LKFYKDVSLRKSLVATIQSVTNAIVQPVNGTSFDRVINLFYSVFKESYVYIIGAEKIDDRRVLNFYNEAKLDLLTDYKPNVAAVKEKGGNKEVIRKRTLAFNFKSPKEQKKMVEKVVDPLFTQTGLPVEQVDDNRSDYDDGDSFDLAVDYSTLTEDEREEMRRLYEEQNC